MRTPLLSRILQISLRLRYSYWFVPTLMMVGSVGLAMALLTVDRGFANGGIELGWVYAGGTDGAREVLSVIAGSMITVAGVVFSITVVALQLASSQFGPRILRNFMRDRGNQIVLGTFVATFVYSLLILRTIHGEEQEHVPALSVSVAVILAVASLAVLIYYIHHAATSIQATHIVRAIGRELFDSIERTYTAPDDAEAETDASPVARHLLPPDDAIPTGAGVHARDTGYVQTVDVSLVTRIAEEHDLVVFLMQRAGAFVSPEQVIMRVLPAGRVDDGVLDDLRGAISTGATRTHEQDVLFAMEQLVEVAVRSLSPGINDPFTAMSCIDWLGAALIKLLMREAPTSIHADSNGVARFVYPVLPLEEILEHSFGRIRTYAHGHPAVLRSLLEGLTRAWGFARDDAARQAIEDQVRLTLSASERSLDEEKDLRHHRKIADIVLEAGDDRPANPEVSLPRV